MVVTVGETDLDVPVTVPTPWLMEREVAFDVDQERVDEFPDVIDVGDAENEDMVGATGAGA